MSTPEDGDCSASNSEDEATAERKLANKRKKWIESVKKASPESIADHMIKNEKNIKDLKEEIRKINIQRQEDQHQMAILIEEIKKNSENAKRTTEMEEQNSQLRWELSKANEELQAQAVRASSLEQPAEEDLEMDFEQLGETETQKRRRRRKNRIYKKLEVTEDSPEDDDTPGTSQKKPKTHDDQPESETENSEKDEEDSPKVDPVANSKRPPPIIVRKKEIWTDLAKTMKTKHIKYTKARMAGGNIQIYPQEAEDHRRLKSHLTANSLEYFTYATEEEKIQKYVIKGIPEDMDTEEIYEELREQGHNPIKVQQMTSRRTKMTIPMYLIDMPNKEESQRIRKLNRCLGLVVTVEDAKRRSGPAQCHRCQGFHHAQNRCTSALRCVKCGLDHRAKDCELPKEDSCKCANCGGPHPANYRGCPRAPKTLRRPEFPPRPTGPAGPTAARPTAARRPGQTYSQAARGQPTTGTPNIHEMMAKMEQFNQMMAKMTEFFNKMMPSG